MNYETFTFGCPLYARCANGNNNKQRKATHDQPTRVNGETER